LFVEDAESQIVGDDENASSDVRAAELDVVEAATARSGTPGSHRSVSSAVVPVD
jgi:hypothetical protein